MKRESHPPGIWESRLRVGREGGWEGGGREAKDGIEYRPDTHDIHDRWTTCSTINPQTLVYMYLDYI